MSCWPDDNKPRFVVEALSPIGSSRRHGPVLVLDRAYAYHLVKEFKQNAHRQAEALAAELNATDESETG